MKNIINMCFHKNNAISFSILDEALLNNKTILFKSIIRSLLGPKDAPQHLRIQQINKQVVI
jgi:hypothetical protein